jgi:chromosome segregation ATPase
VDITPELILAGVAAIAAVSTAMNNRTAAKKDVVQLLQNEVDRDHQRVAALELERNSLADEQVNLKQEINSRNQKLLDLQQRVTDTESRLARSERRAGEAEKQANEFRTDVIRLGEELVQERKANAEKISEMKREHQATINKLVVVIESLFRQLQSAGLNPEFDLEDLKKMYIIDKSLA